MPTPVNPMQLIGMIASGKNPQQLILSILEQNAQNNPVYSNLANLARNNRTSDIEAIVRNISKERGIDYDTAFNNFKKSLGL